MRTARAGSGAGSSCACATVASSKAASSAPARFAIHPSRRILRAVRLLMVTIPVTTPKNTGAVPAMQCTPETAPISLFNSPTTVVKRERLRGLPRPSQLAPPPTSLPRAAASCPRAGRSSCGSSCTSCRCHTSTDRCGRSPARSCARSAPLGSPPPSPRLVRMFLAMGVGGGGAACWACWRCNCTLKTERTVSLRMASISSPYISKASRL